MNVSKCKKCFAGLFVTICICSMSLSRPNLDYSKDEQKKSAPNAQSLFPALFQSVFANTQTAGPIQYQTNSEGDFKYVYIINFRTESTNYISRS